MRILWPPGMNIYLGLVALVIILAGLQATLPLSLNEGQRLTWSAILVTVVLGWIGMILAPHAGFAEMWASGMSTRQRIGDPLLAGIGLGLVMVMADLIWPLGPELQTRFPDSIIVFSLAGLVEEILVHLFLTTSLVWLISSVILKQRYRVTVFWVVAVGVGLAYWLLQMSAIRTFFPEKFSVMLAFQLLFLIAATIIIGAYFYRSRGFVAALALRYGFYLVWHILWGGGIGLVHYLL